MRFAIFDRDVHDGIYMYVEVLDCEGRGGDAERVVV